MLDLNAVLENMPSEMIDTTRGWLASRPGDGAIATVDRLDRARTGESSLDLRFEDALGLITPAERITLALWLRDGYLGPLLGSSDVRLITTALADEVDVISGGYIAQRQAADDMSAELDTQPPWLDKTRGA